MGMGYVILLAGASVADWRGCFVVWVITSSEQPGRRRSATLRALGADPVASTHSRRRACHRWSDPSNRRLSSIN